MSVIRILLSTAASIVIVVLLLASFLGYFRLFEISYAATGNISINSETDSGSELSGYWVVITTTSGATVESGFSPFGAQLAPGNYLVGVGDFGGYTFAKWSDGTTNRYHAITIQSTGTISLTAIYSSNSASSSSGSLQITSSYQNGASLTGMYVYLQLDGSTVASGFTPVSFALTGSGSYTVTVDDYTNAYFYQWSDGSCAITRSVSSAGTLNAIFSTSQELPPSCTTSSGGGSPSGITVSANRIPATYWAPCFALVCNLGTGPGATMFFVLSDASGNVVATGFVDENGYTFTGLTPGATYYVYPSDCDSCHGSTHDVVFDYWGNDVSTTRPLAVTVGESVAAWYSCTNGCSGG